MHSQSYLKKNIALAWPLALNALLMQSMLMIDTLLVSPLGEISLAAMGIATTIVAFILGIQMALANGTQLVLSRAVGSGDAASLSKAFWSGLLINSSVALLFWGLLTAFDTALIQLLTQNIALYTEIEAYIAISKYIVLFTAITQVMIALFNGLSKTKIPFKGYLIELPINALLSYVFIHGYQLGAVINLPAMGVQGAALGSIIAIAVRLIYLYAVIRRSPTITLSIPEDRTMMQRNIKGHAIEIFPIAANVVILSIGATIYQLLYSQLDISAYVAITLLMPWIIAGSQFFAAWSHASAITISQAIGSQKMQGLVKNVNTSIDITVVISILCAVFFALISLLIADIYPDLTPSTYQALAVIAPIYIILPIIRGYNTVHGHILRALGKTTAVFKINFTGQWLISIPICAFLILGLDASIFWAFAVQPFEEFVKALPFRRLARRSLASFDLQKTAQFQHD